MRTRKVTVDDVKSGRITKDSVLYTQDPGGEPELVKPDILEVVRDRIFLVEYEYAAGNQGLLCFDAQGESIYTNMELRTESPYRLVILRFEDNALFRVSDHSVLSEADSALRSLRATDGSSTYHLIDADDPDWRPSC